MAGVIPEPSPVSWPPNGIVPRPDVHRYRLFSPTAFRVMESRDQDSCTLAEALSIASGMERAVLTALVNLGTIEWWCRPARPTLCSSNGRWHVDITLAAIVVIDGRVRHSARQLAPLVARATGMRATPDTPWIPVS